MQQCINQEAKQGNAQGIINPGVTEIEEMTGSYFNVKNRSRNVIGSIVSGKQNPITNFTPCNRILISASKKLKIVLSLN